MSSSRPGGGPSLAPQTTVDGTGSHARASLPFSAWDAVVLAICAGVWGIAYVFIRQGIVLGASPLAFAAVRYALSAGAFATIAAVRREAWPSARGLSVSAAVGGVFLIGLYGGCLYWGEQYIVGGYASVLSTTAPILTVVFVYFLIPRERLGPRSLLGILVGLVGVIVLVAPTLAGGPTGGWMGPFFVIGAMASTAFGSVLLRRFGGGRQGLWQIGAQFGVGALLLGAVALVLPFPEVLPWREGVWAALAALVVFSSVVGYFTYFRLHYRVGPVRANSVTYLIPLVGIAAGSGFFGEPVTVWEVVGFVIVIVGLTLILREAPRSAR